MATVKVYNVQGEVVGEQQLNDAIFGVTVKPKLVGQAIVAQQAGARQNLAHAKDRSEVRGGGRKPWRQKGTGRARHGSIRSPLWRGGGVTFGPNKEQTYSVKINRKAKRKALFMSLSDKVADEKLVVLDSFTLPEVKTKKFFEILQNLKLRPKAEKKPVKEAKAKDTKKTEKKKTPKNLPSVLVVTAGKDETVQRVVRNVDRCTTIAASSLNVLQVVKHRYLLLSKDAVSLIEKTFNPALGKR